MSAETDKSRHQDAIDLARGTGVNLLGNVGKFTRPITYIFAGRVFGQRRALDKKQPRAPPEFVQPFTGAGCGFSAEPCASVPFPTDASAG